MAKIVDPDQLNQGTEITFDPPTKTIDLAVAGNLDDNAPGRSSGAAHQAIYSATKEEWLATASLQKVLFPFDPIFEAKFIWVNDWQPNDAQTRDLIRDGGFRVEVLNNEYAVIISLQTMDNVADLAYYWQTTGWSSTTASFDKGGELNEPILIFDGSNDYRDFLKVALREQGKTHGYGNLLVDQSLSELTYQAYRIPISNASDPNIDTADATIDSTTPYTNIRISYLKGQLFATAAVQSYVLEDVVQDGAGRWAFCTTAGTMDAAGAANYSANGGTAVFEAYAGEQQIGSSYYAFNRIIDLTTGTATAKQIYNWAQRQLRKSTDINADALGGPNQNSYGTVNGEVAMDLLDYVGTTLVTRPGVLIRDFDANDTNAIEFQDITVDGDTSGDGDGLDQDDVPETTTTRTYPFVSAGTMVFNAALVDEPDIDTLYKMFFQYTTRDTGTDIAVTVASGNTATLTSSTTDFSTNFSNGDYVEISGFTTNAVNNGIFQCNGVVSANSMPVRKVNGETLINETAGDSVNLDNDPFDSPDAIVVQDNGSSDITGTITSANIAFDFDYDNNNQGGRTAGQDAPVAVIAQGKAGAQYVYGLFTITRAVGLNFPLNAATDRVYLNP